MFRKSDCYLAGLMVLLTSLILIALSYGKSTKTIGISESAAVSSVEKILTDKAEGLQWCFEDDPYFPSQPAVPVNNRIGANRHRTHAPIARHIASIVPAEQENPEFTLRDNMHILPELDNAIFISTDSGAINENPAMEN